jgi:hypothetical protein
MRSVHYLLPHTALGHAGIETPCSSSSLSPEFASAHVCRPVDRSRVLASTLCWRLLLLRFCRQLSPPALRMLQHLVHRRCGRAAGWSESQRWRADKQQHEHDERARDCAATGKYCRIPHAQSGRSSVVQHCTAARGGSRSGDGEEQTGCAAVPPNTLIVCGFDLTTNRPAVMSLCRNLSTSDLSDQRAVNQSQDHIARSSAAG